MSLTPLTSRVASLSRMLERGIVGPVLLAAVLGLSCTAFGAAKGPAKPHAAPHPKVPHAHPQQGGQHHRGGYHRGGYQRVNVYNIGYGYSRGYHRTGYYRRRGYGGNSQMAWASRMYQQQYQMMMKQRQAESQAFMATFDTNHNGTIEGKERGPAEHYLRERRLGKIPPLTLASNSRNKK
jgi:hypothetical protein